MRRILGLLVSVMVMSSTLAGCAFSDPRIAGTPEPPSANPGLATQAEAAEEIQAAWQALASLAAADPATSKWAAMSATLQAQWRVLVGPDALNRVASVSANIGKPSTLSPEEAVETAETALEKVRDADLVRARQSTGLTAAFWASLAAGAEQVRLGVQGDYTAAIPADLSATIATADPATAWSDLVCRYDEAVFALRSALGFLSSDDSARPAMVSAVATLRRDEASLTSLSTSTTAPSCSGIYQLPPGRDRTASLDLLTTTQQSLLEATAVWLVAAENPDKAIDYLMANATLASPLGLGAAQWPGWPD